MLVGAICPHCYFSFTQPFASSLALETNEVFAKRPYLMLETLWRLN